MNDFPWTLFFVLLAAGTLGGIAILPYALELNPQALDKIRANMAASKKPLSPLLVVFLSSTIQSIVLTAVAAFVGLLAARQVGLGLPILQAALQGRPMAEPFLAILPVTAVVGVVMGLVLLLLERFVFVPRLPVFFSETKTRLTLWKRALTPFYGGLNEEILLRLFVMSAFAWLIGLVWKAPDGAVALGALWLANLLAALLFGLGHLPATRAITPLTPLVVTRALLLNGLGGLAFGFLYINYGLESAMLAHACLDVVMHLIGPELIALGQTSRQPQAA
jgi:hypothetical protein